MESATCWEFIKCIKRPAALLCRTFIHLGYRLPSDRSIWSKWSSLTLPLWTSHLWLHGTEGLSSTPSHYVQIALQALQPPFGFVSLWVLQKNTDFFTLKKIIICHFYPRITHLSKWMTWGNAHFLARPWTPGFSVFLMISQSMNHYVGVIGNGIWRVFLIGKIGTKMAREFLALIWPSFHVVVFYSLENTVKKQTV